MSEPKPSVKHAYIIETQQRLYYDIAGKIELMQVYKKCCKQSQTRPRILSRAICRLAARLLVNKALQLRKQSIGLLLSSIDSIRQFNMKGRADFGEQVYTYFNF